MDVNKTMTRIFNRNSSPEMVAALGVNPAYAANHLQVCWSRSTGLYRLEGAGQFGAKMDRDSLIEIIG